MLNMIMHHLACVLLRQLMQSSSLLVGTPQTTQLQRVTRQTSTTTTKSSSSSTLSTQARLLTTHYYCRPVFLFSITYASICLLQGFAFLRYLLVIHWPSFCRLVALVPSQQPLPYCLLVCSPFASRMQAQGLWSLYFLLTLGQRSCYMFMIHGEMFR